MFAETPSEYYDKKDKIQNDPELEMAEQQFIGFAHASMGYDVRDLAISMGLRKKEWEILRKNSPLKQRDKEDLDLFFNIKD